MSDLIRREDVFKAIVGLTTHKTVDEIEILCDASVADSEGWLGGIRDALRTVEYIPSAEPERKKGEWIIQPSEGDDRPIIWWKCSECGNVIYSYTNREREEFYAYCGRCGADMRGGNEQPY